jgi:hypothetical protein
MNQEPHIIPRIAIQSIATGLLMMAFFTMFWAGIAHAGLAGRDYNIELIVFAILAAAFIIKAVYFFSIAKRFPKSSTEADKAEGKRSGMWFGIIFGAEGLGIFIAINIVNNLGHPELDVPVIALVVGLHFYPMAKLFKRQLDYYLATWSTVIAILSIIFILNKTMTPNNVFAFLGMGLGIATASYGIYMIFNGRGMMRKMAMMNTTSPLT